MLRPISESPSAKALGANVHPSTVVLVKVITTICGILCFYAAFVIAADVIAQPNTHGAMLLGLFLGISALGFMPIIPRKFERAYVIALGIFVAALEMAINLAIVFK